MGVSIFNFVARLFYIYREVIDLIRDQNDKVRKNGTENMSPVKVRDVHRLSQASIVHA